MFLLDSGAFTFLNCKKKVSINYLRTYLEDYIGFINRYKIKYFFELDIDSIIGYESVKRMTQQLEQKTGKQCIPVWHKSRGIKEWQRIISDYNYVAIGGFVTKEIKQSEYKYIPELLMMARYKNCKVHGLGFTGKDALKLDFYSIDSTAWLAPVRYGSLSYFNGREIQAIKKPKNTKLNRPYKELADISMYEYVKYQKYLRGD